MYMGIVQEWIDENQNIKTSNDNELIVKYIQVLRHGKRPLYPFQCVEIMRILIMIEELIGVRVWNDLRNLSDRDLILKYNLNPINVDSRYCSIPVEDIKPSLKRLDIDKMRGLFIKQYDEYKERGWL